MAVHTGRCFRTVTETQRKITVITDMAQQDLLDAISCIHTAAASDRRDFLIACAHEYIAILTAKLKLASNLALSVPELEHERRDGSIPGQGISERRQCGGEERSPNSSEANLSSVVESEGA